MKLQTAADVFLTDHTNGYLRGSLTNQSASATQVNRAIVTFFQSPAPWSDFPDQTATAVAARDDLLSIGLLTKIPPAPDLGILPCGVTMFSAPQRTLKDVTPGEIVFLGAPFDLGTTAFPGCRFGPSALRVASVERFECEFDLQSGRMHAWNVPTLGGAVLGGARLADLGDIGYQAGEPVESYYRRLRAVIDTVCDAGAFPVVLGGDHSISYATLHKSAEALVHLDAHCDLAELVEGHCHHHGNVLNRVLAEGMVSEIHHFGLRETGGWDTVKAGTFAKSVGDLSQPDWADGIRSKRVFVSLDVDILDPSIMPGTGTPVAGGLTLPQLCQCLAKIAATTKPLGLDLVELCPMRDPSGLSERNAIEALLCFLAVYFKTHGASAPTDQN